MLKVGVDYGGGSVRVGYKHVSEAVEGRKVGDACNYLLTPPVTAQVRAARPFCPLTNNRIGKGRQKKVCGSNLSVKWGEGEGGTRTGAAALLLFDLPEVLQCPPSVLFFTNFFPRHI